MVRYKKKYNHIKTKERYNEVIKFGIFSELYPELSGIWEEDKLIIQKIRK